MRSRPRDRRYSLSTDLAFEGHEWTMTVGFYDDGQQPCEIFASGCKSGSLMDTALSDACVLVSLLLQRGVPLEEIRHSLGFGYVLLMVEAIEEMINQQPESGTHLPTPPP